MKKDTCIMKIQIKYFAALREQAGLSEEVVDSTAATPEALYAALKQQYSFSLDISALQVAVNGAYADWSQELSENDEVVFIPPVAGG